MSLQAREGKAAPVAGRQGGPLPSHSATIKGVFDHTATASSECTVAPFLACRSDAADSKLILITFVRLELSSKASAAVVAS